MRGRGSVIVIAAVLCLGAYGAWPQGKQPDAAATTQAKKREIEVDYQSMRFNDRTGEGEYTKAKFQDGDTVFHGDLISFNQKQKVATATGSLAVSDPQADVTGDKAVIYYARGKRLVVLTGNVHITLKPKGKEAPPTGPAVVKLEGNQAVVQPAEPDDTSAESARRHPVQITCDRVEYEYARDRKHATLTGSFRAIQKLEDNTRTLVAAKAEWFGTDERVDLHPPVHYEDTKGNTMESAELVNLSTKEGQEGIAMKKGSGKMLIQDEDEEAPGPAETKPAGPKK